MTPKKNIWKYISNRAPVVSRFIANGIRNYIILLFGVFWILFVLIAVIYIINPTGIAPVDGLIDLFNQYLDSGLAGGLALVFLLFIAHWAFKPYKSMIKRRFREYFDG